MTTDQTVRSTNNPTTNLGNPGSTPGYRQSFNQFVNQDIGIYLNDATVNDRINGKLCAVDEYGIVLSETGSNKPNEMGVFLYPWEAIRCVHLSQNATAFNKVAAA